MNEIQAAIELLQNNGYRTQKLKQPNDPDILYLVCRTSDKDKAIFNLRRSKLSKNNQKTNDDLKHNFISEKIFLLKLSELNWEELNVT